MNHAIWRKARFELSEEDESVVAAQIKMELFY